MKPALRKTPAPIMFATTRPTPEPRSKNPSPGGGAYESTCSLAALLRTLALRQLSVEREYLGPPLALRMGADRL